MYTCTCTCSYFAHSTHVLYSQEAAIPVDTHHSQWQGYRSRHTGHRTRLRMDKTGKWFFFFANQLYVFKNFNSLHGMQQSIKTLAQSQLRGQYLACLVDKLNRHTRFPLLSKIARCQIKSIPYNLQLLQGNSKLLYKCLILKRWVIISNVIPSLYLSQSYGTTCIVV